MIAPGAADFHAERGAMKERAGGPRLKSNDAMREKTKPGAIRST
jgi:hypothetical protein